VAAAKTPEWEVRAEAKWVGISARKARVVAQHIRGRSVPEARTVLAFTQRAAAKEIEKVLRSAVANAEENYKLNGDELLVYACTVDEGPTHKRWRARARGRVARIRKRTCHITVRLTANPKLAPQAPRAAEAATAENRPKADSESKPQASTRRKKEVTA
jgi:large subunit ribosomal protein L22